MKSSILNYLSIESMETLWQAWCESIAGFKL